MCPRDLYPQPPPTPNPCIYVYIYTYALANVRDNSLSVLIADDTHAFNCGHPLHLKTCLTKELVDIQLAV